MQNLVSSGCFRPKELCPGSAERTAQTDSHVSVGRSFGPQKTKGPGFIPRKRSHIFVFVSLDIPCSESETFVVIVLNDELTPDENEASRKNHQKRHATV